MNQIEQMIRKLREDSDFAQKIAALTTREAVVEEARRAGIELSAGDIDAVNEVMLQEVIGSLDQSKSAESFLLKLLGDQDFAREVMEKSELEEVLLLAKAHGMDLTAQDLDDVNQSLLAISRQSTQINLQNGELSEEDLEQVAGGATPVAFTVCTALTSIMVSATVVGTLIGITCVSVMISQEVERQKNQ